MKKMLIMAGVLLLLIAGLLAISTSNNLGIKSESGSIDSHAAMVLKADDATQARVSESYGKLPLVFEANLGQTDDEVKFLSRGGGYSLYLTRSEAVLALSRGQGGRDQKMVGRELKPASEDRSVTTAAVRMELVGSNPAAKLSGLDELPGKSNYFIGNDPQKWRTNVTNYARVRYEDLYPGVDLIYHGNQRRLEYDFVVSPGSDPKAIQIAFGGAERVEIEGNGELVLDVGGGQIRQHRPVVYQEADGIRKQISGGYVLRGERLVGFEVGAYDVSKPLIIDPVLSYSTYLGGSSYDVGRDIAVDSLGNAYVTGETFSADFPTANPLQSTNQQTVALTSDVFVAKLNAAGSELVYSTYLGGNRDDQGLGIAVDSSGNAYVTGSVESTDFPTKNPLQPTFAGGVEDVFVAKLNAAGSALVYSTYLGGSDVEMGYGIAADSAGNAYVTGLTYSTDFPTKNPLQAANAGINAVDAFVAKLNATGSTLVYSTYLGGISDDIAYRIVVDSAGNAYVTGETGSTDFPTKNPLQPTFAGGISDAFVAKLNAAGSALVYSTYLGGSDFRSNGRDTSLGIAVDSAGNAYVTGITRSTDFPTKNPLQATLRGDFDTFVAKLNAAGSALVYSTYLGGTSDSGSGIAVDSAGNAYVTGSVNSTDFPTKNPLQATLRGISDAFVAKLNATGSALVYSTFLGGSLGIGGGDDSGVGIAVDSAGNAYVIGQTFSTDFPTKNPLQPTLGGSSDAFVAKIAGNVVQPIQVAIDIKPGVFPNIINPRSNGVIPVAILTTRTFIAKTTVPTSVRFGATGTEAAPVHFALVDVNGDGLPDLLLQFRTQDTGIRCGATSASLTGITSSGQAITGSDSVTTVGCGRI